MNAIRSLIDRVSQIDVPIQVKASLAVLSAQLCFSGWHIVGSVAFRSGTDPLVFILYRLIIGTSLMHLYVKYYHMNTFIDPADHKRMFIVGLLSFGNVFCGSMSLKFIAPSRFAIFQPSIPCIVTGISMLFKLEEMNRLKICGIALAVAGAFLAELWKTGSSSADEANMPLGVFLATLQVFAMGFLLVAVKPLLNKYDPAVVSSTYFVVTTLAIMVVVLCRIDIIPAQDYAFGGLLLPWLAITYVAVFATMYSFSAINWGGKYLPPTVTTVFFTFQPVGTIILSATLLGAGVTLPEVFGGLLIIAGLLVTSFAQSKSFQTAPIAVRGSTGSENGDNEVTEIEFSSNSNNGNNPRVRSRGSSAAGTFNPLRVQYTAVQDVHNAHIHSDGCDNSPGAIGGDNNHRDFTEFRNTEPDVNVATV